MGFRNFGKTQLGKHSANFNWEGAFKRPLLGLVNALKYGNIILQITLIFLGHTHFGQLYIIGQKKKLKSIIELKIYFCA